MKKKINLIIIVSILTSIIWTCVTFATNRIDISMSQSKNNTILLEINAEKNIKNIKIYLKRNSDNYQLFYQSDGVNSNNKTYRISGNRLSSESETYFKVIVVDEDGEEKVEEFKGGKKSEQPAQSEKPTSSTSPSPTTTSTPKPSQSTTPKPSTSLSPSPSLTPTQNNPEVTGIKLNTTSVTLTVGGTKTITATITPSNAKTTITWSTSNSKVATVSSTGKITAKAQGTATITVKTKNGKTAQCKVKVNPKTTTKVSSSTKPVSKKGDGYNSTIKLGGRTFKLYKQYLGSYAKKSYNSTSNKQNGRTMSSSGCGPTSLAIILSGYGYSQNPYDIGKLLTQNSKPSGLPSMEKEMKALGMQAIRHTYSSNYQKTYNEIKSALESGHQIALYVGKKASSQYWKNFTNSGYHFISVLGIDSSNNKVYVGNPGKSGGWYSLSTVVKARGNTNGTMAGWLELYK